MSEISSIVLNNETYNLQDSVARERVQVLNNKYGEDWTAASNSNMGITYTKIGAMVQANGTDSGTGGTAAQNVGFSNNTLAVAQHTSYSGLTNTNLILKANRKYLVSVKILSGSIENLVSSSKSYYWGIVTCPINSGTVTNQAIKTITVAGSATKNIVSAEEEETRILLEPEQDTQYGFYFRDTRRATYNNLTWRYNIQDITESQMRIDFLTTEYGGDWVFPSKYDDSSTAINVLCTKAGSLIKLTGIKINANATRYIRLLDNKPDGSATSYTNLTSDKFIMLANRTYCATIKFISGNIKSETDSNRELPFYLATYNAATETVGTQTTDLIGKATALIGNGIDAQYLPPLTKIITPTSNLQYNFVMGDPGGITYTDFVFSIDLQDITFITNLINTNT